MQKGPVLYEGKAKIVYLTADPDRLIIFYKDSATAFDGKKRGVIAGKGEVNNQVSAIAFAALAEAGIPTHFECLLGPRESLVRRLDIVPLEVTVRNVVAGSLARRLGLEEGTPLPVPVVETYYKSDSLGDPMVNDDHIRAMGWATEAELAEMKGLALRVNDVLRPLFAAAGLTLVDFKLEFGRDKAGQIRVGDEISPDTCRLWDSTTGEKLDKDRFRRDLGAVEEAYQEVLRRLQQAAGGKARAKGGPAPVWEADVYVTLKEGVLDPQGKAVQGGLRALGIEGVRDVRVGKYIRVRLEAEDEQTASERVEAMCRRLLANPVTENYRFELRREVRP